MKIYELLEKPEAWCQNAYSYNHNKEKVRYNSPSAFSWCLHGAVDNVYEGFDSFLILQKICDRIHPLGIAEWNDNPNRTHSEVLNLCKELDI